MQNAKVYLVGGAVRDHLLGIESKDRDYVVVGSSPTEMIAAGFTQVGASFPVFLHPETNDEYALARTERKTGPGYHGFDTVFDSSVTLEDDLLRRDLTINAMAMTENFQIIDPFHGIEDLEEGILRHTSEAFADDPLRVLRLARFAARYQFRVAPETMELSQKLVQSGELSTLPRERIWTELYKGFSEKDPGLMLKVLKYAGALDVVPFFDYFGTDFDFKEVWVLLRDVESSKTDCNKTDAKVMIAMSHLDRLGTDILTILTVPNHIRDAIRMEHSLTLVLNDLTAESVHKFFCATRFVSNAESETTKLAMFVSKVRASNLGKEKDWNKNMNRLNVAAAAVKKLDLATVVASGDMKTVKDRVDAAKFAAVKRKIK